MEIVDKISQRTAQRFAGDIKEMQKKGEIDKIVFLCSLFITQSQGWSAFFNSAKNEYDKLLKVFKIENGYTFEIVCKKLENKVEVFLSSPFFSSSTMVRFSHPSYFEALPFLLLEDGLPREFSIQYFSKVLFNLAANSASHVAYVIAHEFGKLPENVQNLLFNLAANKDAAYNVALAVLINFGKLPENVQNLLFNLAANKDATCN